MKEVIIYPEKVENLGYRILEMKKRKILPFDKPIIYPDSIVPEKIDEREHALFLIHSISIDQMRQSDKVYSAMRTLHRVLGTFEKLSEIKTEKLENILITELGRGIQNPQSSMTNPVGTIIKNARLLEEKYNGDPERIRQEEIWSTIKEISKFHRYGIPTAALLMKNYVRFGIWHFNETEIPIKIDRHLLRISLGNDLIDIKEHTKIPNWYGHIPKALAEARDKAIRMGYYTKEEFQENKPRIIRTNIFVEPLTKAFMQFTKKTKTSAISLDDESWALGSKGCNPNDKRYCDLYCTVNCNTRNPSDNNAVWFFPDIDKRKHQCHFLNNQKL